MSALYIHIPYCKRICAYCDFHRFADLSTAERVVGAMHAEMEEQQSFLHDRALQTLYFGGGTPSLLPPRELQRFIDHARALFDCRQLAEVTVEVNPDDVTPAFAESLARTDINRVSLGIQSFDDRLLRLMNRRHDAAQALRAVELLQRAGFANITADLIFGFEGFGEEVVERDLARIVQLGIQHVSAYHLTIEPSTRLGRMAERGELQPIPDEQSERLFRLVHDRLTEAGFEHYEVSNYALGGFRSQHNSSYWLGTEYLGIGPGAHSYDGKRRRWSQQRPADYADHRRYEEEQLTAADRLNELIMTSLRRAEGLSLPMVAERFGTAQAERIERQARQMAGYGAGVDGGAVKIEPRSWLTSDAVISALFEA